MELLEGARMIFKSIHNEISKEKDVGGVNEQDRPRKKTKAWRFTRRGPGLRDKEQTK